MRMPPDFDEIERAYACGDLDKVERAYLRGYRDGGDWVMAKFKAQHEALMRELRQLRAEFAESLVRQRALSEASKIERTADTPIH
jgi:hypothetical protein